MKTSISKTLVALLTVGALGIAAGGAQASWGHNGPGYGPAAHAHKQSQFFLQQIHERQQRQMDRIHAGMRQGDLDRREFRELMREQDEVRGMVQRFRADGFIDAREFQRVERALDAAGNNIRMAKHDRHSRHAWNQAPWQR